MKKAFRRETLIKNPIIQCQLCGSYVSYHGSYFCKEKLRLVATIVSFDTAGLHLLTFPILEPYPSKDIEIDFSQVISYS